LKIASQDWFKGAFRGWRPRGLFGKYVVAFVGLVLVVLLANGGAETWLTYQDTIELLDRALSEKAQTTVRRIQQSIEDMERQISFATRASATTVDQRRSDYLLLLQQVGSIERLVQLDGAGIEQLRVTRTEVVVGSGMDYSSNPRFAAARGQAIWLSPVYFDGLDPFVSIAMPHAGRDAGSTVAEVNLRFLSGLIDPAQIGADYEAYVVGVSGRLLAHSDPTRHPGTSLAELPQVVASMESASMPAKFGRDPDGRSVLTASAPVAGLGWRVFFEQRRNIALEPVYRVLDRTALLLALGVALAAGAGVLLARQMVVPIKVLQVGARQLETSDFGHRIKVRPGDEIADLADHFNRMADQLQGSYSRLEQKVAERTRDLEQRTHDLAQSVRELKALEEIGRAVVSSLDIKSVLATIVNRAVELSQADAGAIYRYDASRKFFELAEAHALEQSFQDVIRAATIRLDESILGLAPKEGHTIAIPDLATAPNFPLRDATLAAGYRSVLIVPLLAQDEILGALVVQRRAAGEFPSRTVELMQTFAHQSVLAMKNAQLFREVEQKGRELAIANEHKAQFFANMSHELRTPLNGMLGFSELLVDGLYGTIPDKALEVLDRIQKDGKHLLGLINDVLDISKIDAGQLSLSLSDYSFHSIVETVISSTGSLAHAKSIEVRSVVPPDLPIGYGDERRLTQVVLNLVGNAIKFTDTGYVEIRVDSVGDHFKIAIEDTGPGIPLADQTRIFDEFQQVDNSITREKGGSGLGLSISRRLVRAHGGNIDVHSTPGVGSTFTVVLPVRANEQRQAA
jgi:signal transduction histidine kinase